MNAILSLGGWSIVPDLATQYLLKFVYQTPLIHRTLGLQPAAPNTAPFRRHYGITFAFVVLGYLLYTLIDKALSTQPNFYEILGVSYTVDENGLKLAFRQFAKRNHPDRPGVGKQGEELFMHVRDVFEALKDPAVRFAYDRFGPDALNWRKQCSTPSEFLWHGLSSSSGYHIAGAGFLLFWSVLGRSTPFTFWRYILFFSLLVAELALILAPSPSPSSHRHITPLHKLFPNRVVYQHILFLHQIFMFLNVALLRVTPHLIPVDEYGDPRLEQALLDRTTALISIADRETSKMVHTELQSIAEDPTSVSPSHPGVGPMPHHPSFARMEPVAAPTATRLLAELAPEMESLIIETNVKQGAGPLKTAWEVAVARVHARMAKEAEEVQAEREREVQAELERAREERSRRSRIANGRPHSPSSRETTPTPQSPQPLLPSSSSSPNGGVVKVKTEDQDVVGSGYFMVNPKSQFEPNTPTPATPPSHHDIPRSLMKSVPRTPGELPSPRPSPSPPPPTSSHLSSRRTSRADATFGEYVNANGFRPFTMSPRGDHHVGTGAAAAAGYFAKGTAAAAAGEDDQHVVDRIRARSVSC